MKVRSKFCGHNVKSWFFILVQFCLFFRIFQALDNVALRRMESRSDGCSATELAVEHYERGEVRIWGRKIKRWRVSRESQHCCIHSLRIEKQAPLGDGNLAVTFMRWFLEEIEFESLYNNLKKLSDFMKQKFEFEFFFHFYCSFSETLPFRTESSRLVTTAWSRIRPVMPWERELYWRSIVSLENSKNRIFKSSSIYFIHQCLFSKSWKL